MPEPEVRDDLPREARPMPGEQRRPGQQSCPSLLSMPWEGFSCVAFLWLPSHGLGLHHMGSGIEGCLFEGRVRQTDRQIHACVQVFHLPGHSKMPNQQEPTALPCSPTQVAVAWGILRCLPKSISSKLDRKQSNQVLTWGFWVGKQWFNMPHCHPSSASGSAL